MATKLDKNAYPPGSGPTDFQCFGPPALKDGEFDAVKIADMGCFTQDGKDSNKYYHAAVVKHRTSGEWFVYFEWGRTGASKPNFQFVRCGSEAEAQREFADQLHAKNDKRGEWTMVAGNRVLRARAGKDCYLVRPMATRSTGLPDAKTIKINDGAKPNGAPDPKGGGNGKKPAAKSAPRYDAHTQKLFRDLSVATVQFTRGSMADASLPTQTAIDEARVYLQEAQKRLVIVGDNVDDQVQDRDLLDLTALMYGRIPKKKALRAPPQDWILNQGNILLWQADLDAFESALHSTDIEDGQLDDDPFGGIIRMEYIDPRCDLGKFIYDWWPAATGNRHGWLKSMKIHNAWRIERQGDRPRLFKAQDAVASGKHRITERPLYQPRERPDLNATESARYRDSNTALLFHGTRSVNVTGILRENLRLPKTLVGVVITGAMFGPGIYFADDWKKSAGYTSLSGGYYTSGAGGVRGRHAFMFALDVVCGKPHVAPRAHGYTSPPNGHHCVFGKAGASGVQNNEWIVFDRNQYELRYLVEFAA